MIIDPKSVMSGIIIFFIVGKKIVISYNVSAYLMFAVA